MRQQRFFAFYRSVAVLNLLGFMSPQRPGLPVGCGVLPKWACCHTENPCMQPAHQRQPRRRPRDQAFLKTDLIRAIRAAQTAGFPNPHIVIDTIKRTFTIIPGEPSQDRAKPDVTFLQTWGVFSLGGKKKPT